MGKLEEKIRLAALSTAVVLGVLVQSGAGWDRGDEGAKSAEFTGQDLTVPVVQVQALFVLCDTEPKGEETPADQFSAMALKWQKTLWTEQVEGWYRFIQPSFYLLECDPPQKVIWQDA